MNNLNLLNDLSKGWWYFIIDNIISECIDFLISHILNMLYQVTSFSEYLFFSSASGFFTCQLHRYAFSTYQLHHYSSTSTLPIILDFLLFWALNLLTASLLLPGFWVFLVFLWVLWVLVTTYKPKLTLWKTLMFIAWDT